MQGSPGEDAKKPARSGQISIFSFLFLWVPLRLHGKGLNGPDNKFFSYCVQKNTRPSSEQNRHKVR